jgi:predicted RNase H-like nuclease (RuvC/YqgF family)
MEGITMLEIAGIAVSILGGGFIGSILTNKLGNRAQDTNDFNIIVEEYRGLYQDLKGRVEELDRKVTELSEENTRLKMEILEWEQGAK